MKVYSDSKSNYILIRENKNISFLPESEYLLKIENNKIILEFLKGGFKV
jgi:hypothetical protein